MIKKYITRREVICSLRYYRNMQQLCLPNDDEKLILILSYKWYSVVTCHVMIYLKKSNEIFLSMQYSISDSRRRISFSIRSLVTRNLRDHPNAKPWQTFEYPIGSLMVTRSISRQPWKQKTWWRPSFCRETSFFSLFGHL